MTTRKRLPETGTLVTVRIADEFGAEHTFHGTFMGTSEYLTHATDNGRHGIQYTRYPDEPALRGGEMGKPATYARVYSATGNPMPHDGLSNSGPDHWFGYAEIHVRLDSESVTLTKATKDGKQWVQANLSLDNRRAALVEQVKALDPKLAEAVDRLISDTHDDAFERGKDYEWHANNW